MAKSSGGAGRVGRIASSLSSDQSKILRSLPQQGGKGLAELPGVTQRGRVTQAGAKRFNDLVNRDLISLGDTVGPTGRRVRLTDLGRKVQGALR